MRRDPPTSALRATLQTPAYRIVQEALNNITKHASPATAQVTIEQLPDALTVTGRDDGQTSPKCPSRRTRPRAARDARASRAGRRDPASRLTAVAAGACRPPSRSATRTARESADSDRRRPGSPRSGFRVLLEDEPGFEIIGEAQDGGEAIAPVARRRPDVVLMDIRMPGMDGPEANRRLAGPGAEHPVKVIVITTFDLDEYVFAALRAAAAGFLLKDAQPDVLIDAIHAVANGYGLIAPQVTGRLIRQFAAVSPNPDTAKVLDALSARERDVLLLIAQGKQQRADRQPTLPRGKHRQDPRQQHPRQLNLTSRVQAVIVAYEAGLVSPGTRPAGRSN